jgi:hypothetical protein
MPALKNKPKGKKSVSKSKSTTAQLDIVLGGPLLFIPSASDGNINAVEIFSPNNGHPIGAVFLPGVLFTDAELNDPECERWPRQDSFSLLDPRSYAIDLVQQPGKKARPFALSAIPETNHKVKPGRRLGSNWEVAIAVNGHLSAWASHRLITVKEGYYHGSDAPTTVVAGMHRLTYTGVSEADFRGLSNEPKEYLRANISKGGTLIIMGEIPYHATLLHERQAIDALAKLAGLNLHLMATTPAPPLTRLMDHTGSPLCGHSIILA